MQDTTKYSKDSELVWNEDMDMDGYGRKVASVSLFAIAFPITVSAVGYFLNGTGLAWFVISLIFINSTYQWILDTDKDIKDLFKVLSLVSIALFLLMQLSFVLAQQADAKYPSVTYIQGH